MTTDNEKNQQQVSIWSQLQLENQKINPATNQGNDAFLNRNLQLGNLDRETFRQLSLKADRALLFSSSRTNAIYVHNGLRSLSNIQFVNVLSGSKNGCIICRCSYF